MCSLVHDSYSFKNYYFYEFLKYDKKTTRGKGRLFNSYDKSLLLFCSFLKHAQFGLYFDVFTNSLMYKEDIITYFHDETTPQVYTHITDHIPEGIDSVGIVVIRNVGYESHALENIEMPDSADNIIAENLAASADIPAASADREDTGKSTFQTKESEDNIQTLKGAVAKVDE